MRVEVQRDIVASGRDLRPTAFKGGSIHQIQDGPDSTISGSVAATNAPALTMMRARPARLGPSRMRWCAQQSLQTQPWTYAAFLPCFKSSRREAISAASNAAAQWAEDLQKQKVPDPPSPTWRDVYQTVQEHVEWKAAFEAAMEASSDKLLIPNDPGWEDDPVRIAGDDFLSAWAAKNYGRMSETLSPSSSRRTGTQSAAGATRADFEGFTLDGYELVSVQYLSYGLVIVEVDVTINGVQQRVESRWSYESPTQSMPVPGTDPLAQWSRLFSGPDGWT